MNIKVLLVLDYAVHAGYKSYQETKAKRKIAIDEI